MEQVKILGDVLEDKFCNIPFEPRGHFTIAVLNSLWTLLDGEQFEVEVCMIKWLLRLRG